MFVTVKIKIEREDGTKLTDEQEESIVDQVEAEIPNLSLEEIVVNEGKANETSVALGISVEEIGFEFSNK